MNLSYAKLKFRVSIFSIMGIILFSCLQAQISADEKRKCKFLKNKEYIKLQLTEMYFSLV